MRKTIALLLAIILCLGLFAACGSKTESGAKPAAADDDAYHEIVIGSTAPRFTGHFDPTMMLSDNYNCTAKLLCYDLLFYMDPDTNQYTSDILKEFHFDSDLPGLVMTLKDNVFFSNGDQMTMEDVLFSIQRMSHVSRAATTFTYIILDEASISDDGMTLTLPFVSDYGPWQILLGDLGIVNKSWIVEHGGEADPATGASGEAYDWTDPALVCGSGPYRPTEYETDVYTVFELRDDYWNAGNLKGAYYDKMTIRSYSDATAMMVDYENGDINMAINLTTNDYDRVAGDESLGTAVKVSSKLVATLVMDIEYCEELKDINLRKAIVYGTDANTLATLAYGSLYDPAQGFIASVTPYFVEGLTYEYDPELAKQIVEENGLEGTTLKFVANSGVTASVAEGFQYMMEQIGIVIDLEVYDTPTCISMWRGEGVTSFMLDGSTAANTGNDASVQYMNLVETKDFPCMRRLGAEWNALVRQGRTNSNDEARREAYEALQQAEYEEYSAIPVAEWSFAYCYDDTVASAQLLDTTVPDLRMIVPAA